MMTLRNEECQVDVPAIVRHVEQFRAELKTEIGNSQQTATGRARLHHKGTSIALDPRDLFVDSSVALSGDRSDPRVTSVDRPQDRSSPIAENYRDHTTQTIISAVTLRKQCCKAARL